ncbi:copper chaperone PCu(A)C [Pseudonocardia sp. ICBG1293]|uniref:copper chaperone PCu(A)C n=1 Tax=Pseudonocardia sp. ICBG1293 TaxID=2844382 RepID=UPI001CD00F71|nr:copper chaperone PCu(A)C [Pseudonocardia sp. ICBG1293]
MRRTAPALLALFLLAGCGTAAPTIDVAPPTGTAGDALASVGGIDIRDAAIAPADDAEGGIAHPAGSEVALRFVAVNTGDAADRLVSVSSPLAEDVDISGERALIGGATLLVGGTGSTVPAGAASVTRATVTLDDLRQALSVGPTYPVTLTFERAGSVTLELPVDDPEGR